MQLLQNFGSNIPQWYYNELIALVNTAISKGDYAGGFTFDETSIQAIASSETLFTALTLPEAGTRSIDEDFNYPLSILSARYAAIATELNDFTAKISVLIDILNKDTALLDQLIGAAKNAAWQASMPKISGAVSSAWSFDIGFGQVGFNYSLLDPANGVIYPNQVKLSNYFDLASLKQTSGIVPATTTNTYTPISLSWDYSQVGFIEELYGTDWAELDFLNSDILLKFNPPQINVLLPDSSDGTSPFTITGVSNAQGIPVYVRTLFSPRVSSLNLTTPIATVASAAHVPVQPGTQIHVSTSITTQANTNGSCSLYVQYVDSTGAVVVNSQGTVIQTLVGSLTSAGILNSLITVPGQTNITACKLVLTESNVTSGGYTLNANSRINVPIQLANGYSIDPSTVYISAGITYYDLNNDFYADGSGYVTLTTVPDNIPITITYNRILQHINVLLIKLTGAKLLCLIT